MSLLDPTRRDSYSIGVASCDVWSALFFSPTPRIVTTRLPLHHSASPVPGLRCVFLFALLGVFTVVSASAPVEWFMYACQGYMVEYPALPRSGSLMTCYPH